MKMLQIIVAIFLLLASSLTAHAQSEAVERANRNTVGIISGGVGGTYVQIAQNLSDALDGSDLRIISVLGRGSQQNIADLLFLKGIDAAIVQSDVMRRYQSSEQFADIRERIGYIAKLYNEEVHIVARKGTASIKALEGRPVSFGPKGSGTEMTAEILFGVEQINAQKVNLSGSESMAALKQGIIDAAVFVAGKPTSLLQSVSQDDGLQLIPIEYSKGLDEIYLDATFTAKDYPGLVAEGDEISTLAVGAMLAVYNWKPGTNRFKRVARFTERMFEALPTLQTDAYHPKWREVDLNVEVPGWDRFPAASDWVSKNSQ